MKKIIFVSLLLLSIQFQNVYATSGACSYHGGVNCSAGASSYGKAICNDGWESSTYYSLTDECKSSNYDVCSYSYSSLELNNYKNKNTEMRSALRKSIDADIIFRETSLAKLQTQYDTSVNELQNENDAMWQESLDNIEKQRQGALEQAKAASYAANPYAASSGGVDFGGDAINKKYDDLAESVRRQVGVSNSRVSVLKAQSNIYTSKFQSKIDCLKNIKDGFNTLEESCINQYGSYAIASSQNLKTCICIDGYEFNVQNTACIPTIICPNNSERINGSCFLKDCEKGYQWDNSKTNCVKVSETKTETNIKISKDINENDWVEVPTPSKEDKKEISSITPDLKLVEIKATTTQTVLKKISFWTKISYYLNPLNWFNK